MQKLIKRREKREREAAKQQQDELGDGHSIEWDALSRREISFDLDNAYGVLPATCPSRLRGWTWRLIYHDLLRSWAEASGLRLPRCRFER